MKEDFSVFIFFKKCMPAFLLGYNKGTLILLSSFKEADSH